MSRGFPAEAVDFLFRFTVVLFQHLLSKTSMFCLDPRMFLALVHLNIFDNVRLDRRCFCIRSFFNQSKCVFNPLFHFSCVSSSPQKAAASCAPADGTCHSNNHTSPIGFRLDELHCVHSVNIFTFSPPWVKLTQPKMTGTMELRGLRTPVVMVQKTIGKAEVRKQAEVKSRDSQRINNRLEKHTRIWRVR